MSSAVSAWLFWLTDTVLHCLTDLFIEHGVPEHIRSDNGPEFTAKAVRNWLGRMGVKTLFIEPGSPWENGYNESFNGKLVAARIQHFQATQCFEVQTTGS
jgi:transposase InsO family protein